MEHKGSNFLLKWIKFVPHVKLFFNNRPAVTPFRSLAAMPPEASTRAEILPGCPNLDKKSREAEVGFKPLEPTFPRSLTIRGSRHIPTAVKSRWASVRKRVRII
ncbi:hypothetical protein T265_09941 [Opisthorchis viverrini]|uniref:Uncharacterized protein n=1 Tax=Opisthorchis viverrini TaxID=6198 RepID=A0A074ZF19_OPIVI|nr:hypothetical protein T265_09941 [Opisthorchis viverrini]KER21825.1 hypothetical protein T265_09941 [Opisthorchis viverrini]